MKITILKENLKKGLSIVEKIAGRNLTLPVLNNILLTVKNNLLNLTTTDLELAINYWVLSKNEKEGKITIPAKLLSNFINFLPDKKIILEVKNKILYINCEGYKCQIKGSDAEEFPIIPQIKDGDFIEVNSIPFCQGLSQVVDFTASTQTRPEISGIYISLQKDSMQLASTDSFRLAEKTLYFEEKLKNISKETSFIIPQKTAREIINIFSEKETKLKLYFSPNQVLFESPMIETSHPQIQLISRLIEGEYPNYQEIIPKKYNTQITLKKNEFLNQIKTASLFSSKTNEIKVKIDPKKEGIEIFSQSPELGENMSFLSGKVEGEKIETSFNYRFLIDGISNIKNQEIIFSFSKEKKSEENEEREGVLRATIRPVGDLNYIYVVMPLSID